MIVRDRGELRELHPSAARSASGTTAVRDDYDSADSLRAQLEVTAVAGTAPTLDVVFEDSLDGTNWNVIATFAQRTATGREVLNVTSPFGDVVRARYTIGGSSIAAALTTALTGTNNDLTFTADTAGSGGNSITVEYVNPGTASAALAVTVPTAGAIRVSLATGTTAGAITSTAAQVRDAVNAHAGAAPLVNAALAAGNDGTGVVTAMAATALTGGVDLAVTFSVLAYIQ